MQQKAISILSRHGVMALATLRPDGWPQATTVGYINDGLVLYFLISRTSQKFHNIAADDRVSVAIGMNVADPQSIEGLSMAAHAQEVRDEPYRSQFCRRLSDRHPGYFDPDQLDFSASALKRARPQVVTTIDYSNGLGHADVINIGPDELSFMEPARPDDWGPDPQTARRSGVARSKGLVE